jgi:2-polyprenyl-3-methyl-5-hydroxy-6-metoxy-1,4-benzoquinol methylase
MINQWDYGLLINYKIIRLERGKPMSNSNNDKENNTDSLICMLCGGGGGTFINNLRDDAGRQAVRCNSCGHVQVYPLPEIDEDENYYKQNYNEKQNYKTILHSNQSDEEIMYKYENLAVAQKDSVVGFIPKNSKILEIGSGYGWFVEKMRDGGYSIDGAEISQDRIYFCQKRSGIKLINHNFLLDKTPETMLKAYDAVCLFHVLEHIRNPVAFLNNIKECLKPDGTLLVEVPNFNDYNKKLSVAYNDFTYMYEHLSYFTPESLTFLLNKAGFKNVTIRGVQRYSVENAIWWIRNGKPHTGYQQLELPEGLEWVNQYYKDVMEKELKSYAIMGLAALP